MSVLYVHPVQKSGELLSLVRSAVESEIARLELALERAEQRLRAFEERYGVTSEYFISTMVAEDLQGGDDEYVQWAGEYRLAQRLREKLHRLREIEYSDSGVLQPD